MCHLSKHEFSAKKKTGYSFTVMKCYSKKAGCQRMFQRVVTLQACDMAHQKLPFFLHNAQPRTNLQNMTWYANLKAQKNDRTLRRSADGPRR
jgi:hypothetical protein